MKKRYALALILVLGSTSHAPLQASLLSRLMKVTTLVVIAYGAYTQFDTVKENADWVKAKFDESNTPVKGAMTITGLVALNLILQEEGPDSKTGKKLLKELRELRYELRNEIRASLCGFVKKPE